MSGNKGRERQLERGVFILPEADTSVLGVEGWGGEVLFLPVHNAYLY